MNDAPSAAPSRESSSDSNRAEISPLNGKFTIPGRNCEARSFTGTSRLKINPSASPGSVIASGSNLVSASVKISPSNRNANTQYFSVESVSPKCQ